MDVEIISSLTQFGTAGLIGLLWIMERRHAATRERQLDEAHRALATQRQDVSVLLEVIRQNTAAISTLKQAQDQLVRLLERHFDHERAA